MKTLKNHKNIYKHISVQKHLQTTIVASFNIISDIIYNCFNPVVLYENYFICIFMNINEILKMREKAMGKL